MKYNFTPEEVEEVFDKLGGAEGVTNFLSGKTMVVKVSSDRKILLNAWKTVKLGTYKNADEFRNALKKNGFKIGNFGNDILDRLTLTVSSEEEIQLVNVSVADLGFNDGAHYGDICAKAKELGLELCPNEVGPQLRLQYKDQPKDEWLRIAMEPITDSVDNLRIFGVDQEYDDLCLYGSPGSSSSFWHPARHFIFRLIK